MYYTIDRAYTYEPLGLGGKLSRSKALDLLVQHHRNDDGSPFATYMYYVTCWDGDGGADDEIVYVINAEEFVAERGDIVL